MGLVGILLLMFVHSALLVTDLLILFLLVRIMRRRWTVGRLLRAFDEVGTPLVDEISSRVGNAWARFRPGMYLPAHRRADVTLLVAVATRLTVSLLLAIVTR